MADKTLNVRVKHKYDTEANWKNKNPVLLQGEIGFINDGRYKVGNGTSKWNDLQYAYDSNIADVYNKASNYKYKYNIYESKGETFYTKLFSISVSAYANFNYQFAATYRNHGVSYINVYASSINNNYINDCSIKYSHDNSSYDFVSNNIKGFLYKDANKNATRLEVWAKVEAWADIRFFDKTVGDRSGTLSWNTSFTRSSAFPVSSNSDTVTIVNPAPYTISWNNIINKPSTFTPSSHTHDDRYYTESEVESKLSAKSNNGHTHDDRYYTEAEINSKLSGKSDTNHSHNLSTMINGLSEGTAAPTDSDYYVAQYAGGANTTTTYHRRPHSALWQYIKGKADSVYQPKGSYAASSHTHSISNITNLQSSLDSKLSLSGGTISGLTTISTANATDIGITVTNTSTEKSVSFIVGSGKQNRGIYDRNGDKWMLYADGNNNVYLNGYVNGSISGTATGISSATPTLSIGAESNEITVKTNDNGVFVKETNIGNASIRSALDFKWYNTNWQVGNIRGGSTDSLGLGFAFKPSKDGTLSLKSYIDTNGVYHGNVTGNASSASKLAAARKISLTGSITGSASFDGSGDISINTVTNHSHSQYLLLTGGTMTGDIGIPADKATIDGSVPYAGSAVLNKNFTDFASYKTYLGSFTNTKGTWYNIISTRHRNGSNDGNSYGMMFYSTLTSNGNLLWNKQTGTNTWQGERTILDSSNYTDYAPTKTGSGASGTWGINISGNASTATKLATARTISITGSVIGSASFDGSGNITIATTTGHSHSYVADSGDGKNTTFAYSKAGLNYGDYSWLAGWNGYELRAVNKNQFATAGHTHGNYLGAANANGFYGMAKPDGNTSDWIRTTQNGIIPYQAGSRGNGHSGIGTSGWYFSSAYVDNMYTNKTIIADKVTLQYDSTNACLNFVFA